MSELLVIAVLVMVFNVLDSATTYVGFWQYPEKGLKGEANPVMRWLMLKSKCSAEIVKQGGVLGLVIVFFLNNEILAMRLMGIMLGLVVLNNTYIITIRAIMRRKVISPGKVLQNLLRISDNKLYFVMVVIIAGLAIVINNVIFGW